MGKYNEWSPKQVQAYHSTTKYRYTLFGGAKGGGKSVAGCRIIQTLASNYRDAIFIVMRKNYSTLQKTTKRTFEKQFDPSLIVRKTKNIWYLRNNNQIWFWAADNTADPDYEKTRGLECTFIFVDEASELTEQLYELLPTLLRQPAYHIDTGEEFMGNIFMTSNPVPGTNYLKRNFVDPRTRKRDGQHNYIRSLPDENSFLPKSYIKSAFGNMNKEMLRMYRYGDWDVAESEFNIIVMEELRSISKRMIEDSGTIIAAGIDIGLGKPDKTVVWVAYLTGEMRRFQVIEEYDTMRQVKLLSPICSIIKSNNGVVWIDSGSVGKGVADRLSELFEEVIVPISFGERAHEEEYNTATGIQYENMRSQMYFWAREDVSESAQSVINGGEPTISVELNDTLEEEAENTFYIPGDGKLRIEPKSQIKERINRSPDDFDGFVLCNGARRSYKARPVYVSGASIQRNNRTSTRLTSNY